MKGEALIALLAYTQTSTHMQNVQLEKQCRFLKKYNFFPMTSQGLRKVCVGEKAHPQDILRPKS